MRKQLWQKSTNGPDWTDLEIALRSVDATHLGKTGVLISAAGIGGSGGLSIVISTVWEQLAGATTPDAVDSESHWPCPEGCTLEGHILGGIYAHDYAIGRAYEQKILPEA